jgi:hypothetical protein
LIFSHLRSDGILVLLEEQQPCIFLTLLLSVLRLLLLQGHHEFLTLGFGYLLEFVFTLAELSNSCIFQTLQELLLLLLGDLFLGAELEFVLLLDLPGSDSIKLSLPVGCLLLHFPKSLYFSLAFFPLT